MSIDTALQRVATLEQAAANPAALAALAGGTAAPAAGPATSASVSATAPSAPAASTAPSSATLSTAPSFALALQNASGGAAGARIVQAAESQIGQAEQPPGSNESPAIAQYRGASAGAVPGAPWCAYFASWAARQAGEPLGAQGEGLGSVSQIWSWAQSTGRAEPNSPGVLPKPGDLIVFGGEHVGIVRGVLPDGSIQTVEGNYNNQVSLNVRPAGEASGYVSMS